ncbi:MAG: hypothetical protein Q8Q73_01620, partial [Stagnimonas sp.]|nr:hypothetical protein [Stagnimonas sp.]
MFKPLVVALVTALVTATSALAAQSQQPTPRSGFQLLSRATELPAARQKSRLAPPQAQRRSVSLKLPAATAPSLAGYRSQRDEQQSASTFLWADAAIKTAPLAPLKAELMADAAARDYLARQAGPLQLSKRSIQDARLVDLHDTGKGPLIARYQQVQDGIEVFGKRVNVMMDR